MISMQLLHAPLDDTRTLESIERMAGITLEELIRHTMVKIYNIRAVHSHCVLAATLQHLCNNLHTDQVRITYLDQIHTCSHECTGEKIAIKSGNRCEASKTLLKRSYQRLRSLQLGRSVGAGRGVPPAQGQALAKLRQTRPAGQVSTAGKAARMDTMQNCQLLPPSQPAQLAAAASFDGLKAEHEHESSRFASQNFRFPVIISFLPGSSSLFTKYSAVGWSIKPE